MPSGSAQETVPVLRNPRAGFVHTAQVYPRGKGMAAVARRPQRARCSDSIALSAEGLLPHAVLLRPGDYKRTARPRPACPDSLPPLPVIRVQACCRGAPDNGTAACAARARHYGQVAGNPGICRVKPLCTVYVTVNFTMQKKILVTFLFACLLMLTTQNNSGAQTPGRYADVHGLHMYYEIHGEGFPLVLIHGGGSTIGTTFGRILPALAQTHRVIAVELQAHGHTADIDRPLSFEQDADDVAALLQHLGIGRADIFGFSNGASTTLQLAIRHPGMVNRIVVASTMYKRSGAYPWLWEAMARPSFGHMPQALKDAYLAINPDTKALYAMYERDVARMQSFTDISDDAIGAIRSPALIIAGDRDVVRPEHAVELYRRIPRAQLAIFPGGHGDYMGELTTLKPGQAEYPVLPVVEAFLNGE